MVVAPTGISALSVNAQTIHSFFKFPVPHWKMKNLRRDNVEIYKKLEILIIDEISMVRADLFDKMSNFLKVNRGVYDKPGVQDGDMFQLAQDESFYYKLYRLPYFFKF